MPDETIVLDRKKKIARSFRRLQPEQLVSASQIRGKLESSMRHVTWICVEQDLTNHLVRAGSALPNKIGNALLLHQVSAENLPALRKCFDRVAFALDQRSLLPPEELAEVLASKHRSQLIIGGFINRDTEIMTLWRGDLRPLIVPLSAFEPSGTTEPDFTKFSVIDCGNAIKLGEYEASTDSILYEIDSEYRREKKKDLQRKERSLGASLRRLRKQRKLSRADFSPLSSKTIARIERGESPKPHSRTVAFIAKKLGVAPGKIKDY